MAGSGDRLPKTLLNHNISGKRDRQTCELAHVDADIVVTFNELVFQIDVELKDYRIHTQFARAEEEKRVVLHILMNYPNRIRWAIHIPLQAIIKGFGDVEEGYMCYSHSINMLDESGKRLGEDQVYCGITSRNWLQRMAEHFREIQKGSNKHFHQAWRLLEQPILV